MGTPVAFISYSAKDIDLARALADALRARSVDVWIDEEQIRLGDSVPGRIQEGLKRSAVLLVLVTEQFLASSWCRAEYEPLLVKEIDSGVTSVIPVRLDEAELPPLLSAKRYVDLRAGFEGQALNELATTVLGGRSVAHVNRLIPRSSSYEASALSMIVSGTLEQFPVPALHDAQLVHGQRLIDLYRTVERLIERYQALFDELFEVLSDSGIEDGFYGSGRRLPQARLASANRKLIGIAADMREIAVHLDQILGRESELRVRLEDVLQLCVEISVAEDFLVLSLGAPGPGGEWPGGGAGRSNAQYPPPERYSGLSWTSARTPVPDNINSPSYGGELGAEMLRDINRVRSELDGYQRDLRSAVARARVSGSH